MSIEPFSVGADMSWKRRINRTRANAANFSRDEAGLNLAAVGLPEIYAGPQDVVTATALVSPVDSTGGFARRLAKEASKSVNRSPCTRMC
jgi:hypothetical protein